MNKNNDVLTGLELGRYNSIQTRKLKKLNSYVKNKSNLAIKYHNELIDNLIETGLYNEIYDKISNDKEKELTDDDICILKTFNYIAPEELKTLYK